MTGVVVGQKSLFTHRGSPYNPETEKRELRVDVMVSLAEIFGHQDLPQTCLECGKSLKLLLHPHAPHAWCGCGFVLEINKREGSS